MLGRVYPSMDVVEVFGGQDHRWTASEDAAPNSKPPGSRWGAHEHNLHIRMPSYSHQRLVDRQNDGDNNDSSGVLLLAPHSPP